MERSIWTDKMELAELVAILSSAVDRADEQRIASCYTDESFDDHGTFKGSGRQFAALVAAGGSTVSMHHLLGQSVFDVDGDEAWGETFFVFHGRLGSKDVSAHGRYVDYFRRIGDRWKLAYRRVVPDAVVAGDDPDAYWRPARDGTDPVFDRLTAPPGRTQSLTPGN